MNLDEVLGEVKPRHLRVGFPANFDSWCDAGDHEIKEGEAIINTNDQGYVHVDCL